VRVNEAFLTSTFFRQLQHPFQCSDGWIKHLGKGRSTSYNLFFLSTYSTNDTDCWAADVRPDMSKPSMMSHIQPGVTWSPATWLSRIPHAGNPWLGASKRFSISRKSRYRAELHLSNDVLRLLCHTDYSTDSQSIVADFACRSSLYQMCVGIILVHRRQATQRFLCSTLGRN